MKVLLFGNIAAGKTTIANKILKRQSPLEYLAIDDFRKALADGSIEKENYTVKEFAKAIQIGKHQLLEATGFGNVGRSIYDKLSITNEPILIVIILTDLKEIFNRIKKRKWEIPYPDEFKQLEKTVKDIHQNLRSGKICKQWSSRKSTSILKTSDIKLVLETINYFLNQSIEK